MNRTLKTALAAVGIIVAARFLARTFPPFAPLSRFL